MHIIRIHAGGETIHVTQGTDRTYAQLERMVSAGQWSEPIGTTLDMSDAQGTIIYSRTW